MPRQKREPFLASRAHSGVLHAARTAYRHPRVASEDASKYCVGRDFATETESALLSRVEKW